LFLVAVTGVLKGYDGLVNLVVDDCREYIQGEKTKRKKNQKKKKKKKQQQHGEHSLFFCFVAFAADANDPEQTTDETRYLGLLVCRGTAVTTIGPPGEAIANPFAAGGGDDEQQ
jgi:small nuclear ribonucleoprotein (snRNP)-like protein